MKKGLPTTSIFVCQPVTFVYQIYSMFSRKKSKKDIYVIIRFKDNF